MLRHTYYRLRLMVDSLQFGHNLEVVDNFRILGKKIEYSFVTRNLRRILLLAVVAAVADHCRMHY